MDRVSSSSHRGASGAANGSAGNAPLPMTKRRTRPARAAQAAMGSRFMALLADPSPGVTVS
jgi:hypothetical protein